ncbi:hypothetical protein D1871_06595 [Nakamurella silvestris]|nr:hypothetical protein D1871_06595 [Nakamurella silvestris]
MFAGMLLSAGCSTSADVADPPLIVPVDTASLSETSPSDTSSSIDDPHPTDPPTGSVVDLPSASGATQDPGTATGSTAVDANTVSWFTTACKGWNEIENLAGIFEGEAPSTPEELSSLARALRPLAREMQAFAAELEALRPPTIDGGERSHVKLVDSFAGFGTALDQGADAAEKIVAAPPKSLPDAVGALAEDLDAGFTSHDPPIAQEVLPSPSAELKSALAGIPACAGRF